mgnify:FL=1
MRYEVARVIAPKGEPIEFIHKGRRFHIHAVLSHWRKSGGWWSRIHESELSDSDILDSINDNPATIWRVEAAPLGALTTFEIELDEISKCWQIRPTSRSA